MTTATANRAFCVVGLHHVALAAQDVAAAARFYRDAAHCQPWPAAAALGLSANATPMCSSNAGLVLLPADPATAPVRRPVNEAGIAHVCLQTPDIAALVGRFKAHGATLHNEPIDLGTGFLYCYARDPECNVIEIECVAPVWPDPRPWLAHANIVTHDLPRLLDFYGRWLGTQAVRSPRLHGDTRLDRIADLAGVQTRMAWLGAGNAQIELMHYLHPATTAHTGRRAPGVSGFAHLAFEVTQLAQACAHLVACGGCIDDGAASDLPPWQAAGCDPDGNRVLLLDLLAAGHQDLRIAALADPHITQRFAAARAALSTSPSPALP